LWLHNFSFFNGKLKRRAKIRRNLSSWELTEEKFVAYSKEDQEKKEELNLLKRRNNNVTSLLKGSCITSLLSLFNILSFTSFLFWVQAALASPVVLIKFESLDCRALCLLLWKEIYIGQIFHSNIHSLVLKILKIDIYPKRCENQIHFGRKLYYKLRLF
jgi:hypothetical protein